MHLREGTKIESQYRDSSQIRISTIPVILSLSHSILAVQRQMEGWMDGWMAGLTDGQTGGRMDGQPAGRPDGRTYGPTDSQTRIWICHMCGRIQTLQMTEGVRSKIDHSYRKP